MITLSTRIRRKDIDTSKQLYCKDSKTLKRCGQDMTFIYLRPNLNSGTRIFLLCFLVLEFDVVNVNSFKFIARVSCFGLIANNPKEISCKSFLISLALLDYLEYLFSVNDVNFCCLTNCHYSIGNPSQK